MLTIRTADGVLMEVIASKRFTIGPKENPLMTRTVERVAYTCRRPRGRRTYTVIGYENGTNSTAV